MLLTPLQLPPELKVGELLGKGRQARLQVMALSGHAIGDKSELRVPHCQLSENMEPLFLPAPVKPRNPQKVAPVAAHEKVVGG